MKRIRRSIEEVVSWFRPVRSSVLPEGIPLLAINESLPSPYSSGLEILNDDKTPMDFVCEVLEKELNMSTHSAVLTALQIHHSGGVLLLLQSTEQAERAATAIAARARAHSHPLACRAIVAQQAAAGDARNARA